MSVINLNKDSSHGEKKKGIKKIRIIRLTHLLIHKLRRAPSQDFLHTMPVSYIKQYVSCVCVSVSGIFLRFRYQTRRSSLLSPASHSLCALRIHDAKVRSANGFNGAPTIEISLRRPLLARY